MLLISFSFSKISTQNQLKDINKKTSQDVELQSNNDVVSEKLNAFKHTSKKIQTLSKLDHEPNSSNMISSFLKDNTPITPKKINETLNDFETPSKKPKPIKKSNDIPTKKPKRKTKVIKDRKQPDLRKLLKNQKNENLALELFAEQSLAEDVDPDELQTTLALSRTLYESLNNIENEEKDEFKVNDMQHCLEKFGFKTGSTRGSAKYKTNLRRNKIRKTYSTNTWEYFNKNLNEKIDLIFTYGCDKDSNSGIIKNYQVTSDLLQEHCQENSTLFKIQSTSMDSEKDLSSYYTGNLLEKSYVKSGYLLKDWKQIPGRSITPEKKNILKTPSPVLKLDSKKSRSESPDLFASDNEISILEDKESVPDENFSERNNSHHMDEDNMEIVNFENFSSEDGKDFFILILIQIYNFHFFL